MKQCGPALLVALSIAGCSSSAPTSRVVLPAGVKPPKGLKPDPIPPRPKVIALPPRESIAAQSVSPNDVQIEGVCRYDEHRMDCWDPRGKSVPAVVGKVRQLLGSAGTPVVPGRVNRLLAVRLPQVSFLHTFWPSHDGKALPPLAFIGKEQVWAVDAEPHATQISISILERVSFPKALTLPLRKGATGTFAGRRFQVREIQPWNGKVDEVQIASSTQGWQVTIDVAGKPDPHLNLMLVGAMPAKKIVSYKLLRIGSPVRERFVIYLGGDPKVVKDVSIGGDWVHEFDITHIPMDPR